MGRHRSVKAAEEDGAEIVTHRSDYSVCMDAKRQPKPMPSVPLLGATRLTCFDARSKHKEAFIIPGQVIVTNADQIIGCVLQVRVIIADKKDSNGNPMFFDIKVMCPGFEPTTAYVNGKTTKMSIQ